jgi:hypothetical protein
MNYFYTRLKVILFSVGVLQGAATGICAQAMLNFAYYKNPETQGLSSHFLSLIRDSFKRMVFIETGTYSGLTTQVAAELFHHVYTVELSDTMYTNLVVKFRNNPRIHVFHDDSPHFIRSIVPALKREAVIFWLDAHYCGVGTARGESDTPVMYELHAIKETVMRDALILIDDIRCFGSSTEEKRFDSLAQYPTWHELCDALYAINPAYRCYLIGDILLAYNDTQGKMLFSPMVHACTFSRFYNSDTDDLEILEHEAIISRASEREYQFFASLHRDMLYYKTDEFHYYLWYGLAAYYRADYTTALAEFQRVLDKGYTHWRIYWYHAHAAQKCELYEQAKQSREKACELNPRLIDQQWI